MPKATDNALRCPQCGGSMHKAGRVWSGHNRVQRYRCNSCGATSSRPEAATPGKSH